VERKKPILKRPICSSSEIFEEDFAHSDPIHVGTVEGAAVGNHVRRPDAKNLGVMS